MAHLIFYSLLGFLLFLPSLELIGMIVEEKYLRYMIYLWFPLYLFLLARFSLHSLNYYLNRVVIYQENNRQKVIIFSSILFLFFEGVVIKISWGIFGFSYIYLIYGITFLIGFYVMLNNYFYTTEKE